MRAFAVIIAAACALWAVDRYEFHGRYGNNFLRTAQNKADLVNSDVKRWFKSHLSMR
jgi:hypothetical protein